MNTSLLNKVLCIRGASTFRESVKAVRSGCDSVSRIDLFMVGLEACMRSTSHHLDSGFTRIIGIREFRCLTT